LHRPSRYKNLNLPANQWSQEMSSHKTIFALILFLIIASFSTSLFALQDDIDQRRSEIGIRQRQVEQKMVELEAKLAIVMERMRANGEIEQAERLQAALNESKKRLIVGEMGKIAVLLDNNRFDEADKLLTQVIDDLDELVRLLLNEKRDEMSKEEEAKALERWKKQLEDIKKEQQKQTDESRKIANKEDTLKNLDDKIKAVDELIKEQDEVIKKTDENSKGGVAALDRVANRQFDVRKKTEGLADQIAKEGRRDGEEEEPKSGDPKAGDPKSGDPKSGDPKSDDPKSGDPKSGDPKSGDPKSGNPKSGDPKSGDPKSGDPKSGDPKAGDPKSGDPKSGDPKSGDPKSGDPKSGDPKSGDPKSGDPKPGNQNKSNSNQPKQPGQQPLQNASENQQKAEQKLSEGQPTDAKRAEQRALDELNKAREELDRERKRIASMKPEEFQRMAAQQRRTREKVDDVAKEMQKAPKPSDSKNANANQQQKQPGQQALDRASDNMKNASEGLEEQDPQKAERQQKQSEKEIEKALEEIEERLNQLREETREEKLARLESRFREMLERQQVISLTTVELDDKKENLGGLRRRDELTLMRLAMEELELKELGQQAFDLLIEDGTSIVFPEIVQDMREDLGTVADHLQNGRTDQLTQLIQLEIESTLQELLDALKQAKSNRDGGGGGGGGGGGEPPLLRKSAELKMLRAAQMRVNRRTTVIDRFRATEGADADTAVEIQKTATRQAEIVEMAERVMEKQE
jgi:DNA repair exonuclease SbcCD ATPase subunit